MQCFHPLRAWRTKTNEIQLAKEPPDGKTLQLPCGNCLACKMAYAKAWALRCQLELQQHQQATFITLTYEDSHLPSTLSRRHMQLWLKRLRKQKPTQPIRFFACGEYGEQTKRPHYHALLFGVGETDAKTIEQTWAKGYTLTKPMTPENIAYVAGYTNKKIGYNRKTRYKIVPEGTPDAQQRVRPSTGEVYYTITTYQAPFLQMSRNPGIGAHAKQWANSWRTNAVMNGFPMPVPRYLHEAWKQQATTQQIEDLDYEKYQKTIANPNKNTEYDRKTREQIAKAKHKNQQHKRKL